MTTQAALALVSRPAPVPTGRVRCIALTGHRAPGLQPGASDAIRHAIGQLVIQHPGALWLAGGATGADMIATSELLDGGQQVRLILPFVPAIQARQWSLDQRRVLLDHVARASGVEVVAEHYSVAAYHERNRRLVQQADLLVAFYDGRRTGGTYQTIQQAASRHLPVMVWWV